MCNNLRSSGATPEKGRFYNYYRKVVILRKKVDRGGHDRTQVSPQTIQGDPVLFFRTSYLL
jgi:hypothetical protein